MFARTRTFRWQITASLLMAACLLGRALPEAWHRALRGGTAAGLVYGQSAVTGGADGLRRLARWLGAGTAASEDLRAAREEILQLRQQLAIAESQLLERDRALRTIRETLGVQADDAAPPLRFIAATVVGRDASHWPGILILDKGRAQGVEEGSGVIAGKAVVGVVAATRGSACVVRLLTHRQCRVAAYVPRTAESRHVTGCLTDTLRMLDVHEQPVQVGDAVLTSGEMGVFPRGLLIGSVLHVSQTPGSLTHSIDVRPAAALATVHDVLIVLPRRSDALDLIREQGR